MSAGQEVPLLTPPSAWESSGREEEAPVVKAAERKKLLTDKKIPPHSLHRHFTGIEEEEEASQGAAELLISGDLPCRRSGSIQRYI